MSIFIKTNLKSSLNANPFFSGPDESSNATKDSSKEIRTAESHARATHHSGSLAVSSSVAEGAGESARAALVVQRRLAVVHRRIHRYRPHGGGVAVAVAVVVGAAVARRPHVNRPEPVAALRYGT